MHIQNQSTNKEKKEKERKKERRKEKKAHHRRSISDGSTSLIGEVSKRRPLLGQVGAGAGDTLAGGILRRRRF